MSRTFIWAVSVTIAILLVGCGKAEPTATFTPIPIPTPTATPSTMEMEHVPTPTPKVELPCYGCPLPRLDGGRAISQSAACRRPPRTVPQTRGCPPQTASRSATAPRSFPTAGTVGWPPARDHHPYGPRPGCCLASVVTARPVSEGFSLPRYLKSS